jgi:hypothetical protein
VHNLHHWMKLVMAAEAISVMMEEEGFKPSKP